MLRPVCFFILSHSRRDILNHEAGFISVISVISVFQTRR